MSRVIASIGAGTVLLFGIIFWFYGLGFLAFAETIVRGAPWAWLILLSVGVPLAFAFLSPREPLIGFILAGVLGLGTIGYSIGAYGYTVNKAYAASMETVEEVTNYNDRAPYTVAENYASRDQGDVIGEREGVHAVPNPVSEVDSETTRYTALVKERQALGMGGYEAIQEMQMPNVGSIPGGVSEYCEIPESMGKKLNSFYPWKNLDLSIYAKKPFAHWSSDDSYGYCDDGEPTIVVPLWKYEGVFHTTKTPNGAAIYTPDGLEIMTPEQLVENKIEGPTYPRHIAQQQREAINATGSLGQYWSKNHGYETTDKDEEDTNLSNYSEFTVVDADGKSQYVTPLTPRGTSASLTAVVEVPAQQVDGKRYMKLNTSTDLPATSTIATNIRESSVSGDNSWTSRWAAGMTIYEVLPAQDGHWVASIGQGQAVSYRADISPEGVIDITNTETGQSSKGDDAEKPSVSVDGGKPLAEMSEEELLQLIDEAVTELQQKNNS